MEASSVQSSSISGALSSVPAVAMGGVGSSSPTIDKKALRLAKGDISVRSSVPLNQQMFIYSINLHLMKISHQQLAGSMLDRPA